MAQQQTRCDHIEHCLDQIKRFADMLACNDTSRSRDAIVAQLFYNLGRYGELSKTDGRELWRTFELAIINKDYSSMTKFANMTATHVHIIDGNYTDTCTVCMQKCKHKVVRDLWKPKVTQCDVAQYVCRCTQCGWNMLMKSPAANITRLELTDEIDSCYDSGMD